MLSLYILILLAVLINVAAQLLLKVGMQRIGYFEFSTTNLLPIGLQAVKSLPLLIGFACYVVSMAIWMMVLSRMEVSQAYPLSSLAYVFVAISAWWLFGENLSALRLSGIGIIVLGVWMVSQSR